MMDNNVVDDNDDRIPVNASVVLIDKTRMRNRYLITIIIKEECF